MCVFKEFSSQAALSLGKREVEVRSRWSEAAKVCAEFASKCARSGRFILCAATLSFPLAGCVTTASVPSSPFLTAVARLSPFQANANANGAATDLSASARNANAAASEDIATGSVSPVTAVPFSGPQSEGHSCRQCAD